MSAPCAPRQPSAERQGVGHLHYVFVIVAYAGEAEMPAESSLVDGSVTPNKVPSMPAADRIVLVSTKPWTAKPQCSPSVPGVHPEYCDISAPGTVPRQLSRQVRPDLAGEAPQWRSAGRRTSRAVSEQMIYDACHADRQCCAWKSVTTVAVSKQVSGVVVTRCIVNTSGR